MFECGGITCRRVDPSAFLVGAENVASTDTNCFLIPLVWCAWIVDLIQAHALGMHCKSDLKTIEPEMYTSSVQNRKLKRLSSWGLHAKLLQILRYDKSVLK